MACLCLRELLKLYVHSRIHLIQYDEVSMQETGDNAINLTLLSQNIRLHKRQVHANLFVRPDASNFVVKFKVRCAKVNVA